MRCHKHEYRKSACDRSILGLAADRSVSPGPFWKRDRFPEPWMELPLPRAFHEISFFIFLLSKYPPNRRVRALAYPFAARMQPAEEISRRYTSWVVSVVVTTNA